jgi:[ribosomal protein S5]-alanine N-acetyltransferase
MNIFSNIIETPRLEIIPFTENHISDKYISWLNDPIVVRYSVHQHYKHNKQSCMSFLEQMHGAGSLFSAIFVKVDSSKGRHVGNIVANFDPPNGTADLTILIGERDVWGKGVGSEAWIATMNYLFVEGGIRKVTAGTVERNNAMLAIMSNAGMHEEARRKRQYIIDGDEVDLIYFARYQDEGKATYTSSYDSKIEVSE